MDKVSFVIVRADQVELCGATVNAVPESRLCIREGCAVVHKVEVRRSDRELSPNHMYLLAPVSNNKLVVIPYPRLNLEGLDESAKGCLPGKVPVECEDGINILNLLDLELTVGRLWDVLYLEKLWYKYFEGHMAARSFLLNHCSNNLYCSFRCSHSCFVVLLYCPQSLQVEKYLELNLDEKIPVRDGYITFTRSTLQIPQIMDLGHSSTRQL